jgi:hypothetical protein
VVGDVARDKYNYVLFHLFICESFHPLAFPFLLGFNVVKFIQFYVKVFILFGFNFAPFIQFCVKVCAYSLVEDKIHLMDAAN